MIELTSSKEGLLLDVHAQPGARRNGLIGERAGALRVAVTAPPDKGKANAAILEVLAEALGLRLSAIALVSGETSRHKRVLLAGIDPEEAARRIAAALPEPKTTDKNS
ncbi:DUF167 domain-containing protein [Paludisphaera soli]|uniref:DUF167 domain-containing protein n=1 Tax=Paludisphaera soli TaxID=2712865 RepID=UPI0013EC429F|nr:DUF167 domain-containing protein [Paludisphaera soli]